MNHFYRDGVGNTVEENSCVFSLMWMHQLPVAIEQDIHTVKLCSNRILKFLTGGAG